MQSEELEGLHIENFTKQFINVLCIGDPHGETSALMQSIRNHEKNKQTSSSVKKAEKTVREQDKFLYGSVQPNTVEIGI